MYLLKNAWISITRNKGRNILIGIIIFIIACASTITLAIHNTANDLIESYTSSYEKELTLTFNRTEMRGEMNFSKDNIEKIEDNFSSIQSYTVEDISLFATNEHIESYYYTYSISLNGNTIEKASMNDFENESDSNRKGNFNMGGTSSLDFTLTGYSSMEAMSEFINGTYQIVDIESDAWDYAFDGNYVFLNEELAEYNDLAVGDTIKLEAEDGTVYAFTIIGIYTDNDTSNDSGIQVFSNSINTIITNVDALIKISEENSGVTGTVNPTFIIDSYDNAQEIQSAFYEMGLDENYVVNTNEEEALSGISSVSNVKTFATTFLIITLFIGGVVLFILNLINIRERKYEIGVFRTIGLSKIKLTLQFVSELLIVAFVALLIGASFGAVLSKSVSNSLLASEIENTKNQTDEIQNNFGGNMKENGNENKFHSVGVGPVVEAYDSIDAVVNFKVIFELLGIGLLLVLVSSLAAMISIQRFSPLSILKERS